MLASSLPRIIAGTSHLGSVVPHPLQTAAGRERAFKGLDTLLEVGFSGFDLAASYQLGGTERLFGDWLSSRRIRDRVFLISKGGHPLPLIAPHRLDADALVADLHSSLKRLRTERLDLYLLHRDDTRTPLEMIVETMAGFTREGKIAAWGVSNWTPARIQAIDQIARVMDKPTVAASSPHFSLVGWSRPPWSGSVSIVGDTAAIEYHTATQLPVFAWSPLGGGFFSPQSGRESRSHRYYGTPANIARRERAVVLGRKRNCTPAQIALAYLLHQPFPVIPVVASTNAERMQNNFAATSIRLVPDEVRWLECGKDHETPRGAE